VPSLAHDQEIQNFAAVAGLCTAIRCTAIGIHASDAENWEPFFIGLLVGCMVGLGLILAVLRARNPPSKVKARQEIKSLEQDLERLAKGIGPPPPKNDEAERAAKRFGENLGSAGYRKMFAERAAFLRDVLRVPGEVPPDLAEINVGRVNIASTLAINERGVREARDLIEGVTEAEMEEDEELVQQAVEVFKATRCAKTSTLQLHMRIGYNWAARIMELREERGIVGPENGAAPRDPGGPGLVVTLVAWVLFRSPATEAVLPAVPPPRLSFGPGGQIEGRCDGGTWAPRASAKVFLFTENVNKSPNCAVHEAAGGPWPLSRGSGITAWLMLP
jgi:hypothetical protein